MSVPEEGFTTEVEDPPVAGRRRLNTGPRLRTEKCPQNQHEKDHRPDPAESHALLRFVARQPAECFAVAAPTHGRTADPEGAEARDDAQQHTVAQHQYREEDGEQR